MLHYGEKIGVRRSWGSVEMKFLEPKELFQVKKRKNLKKKKEFFKPRRLVRFLALRN